MKYSDIGSHTYLDFESLNMSFYLRVNYRINIRPCLSILN